MNKHVGHIVKHMVDAQNDRQRGSHAEQGEKALGLPEVVQIGYPIAKVLDVERMDENANPYVHVAISVAEGFKNANTFVTVLAATNLKN